MVTIIKRKVGDKDWLYCDIKHNGQRQKKALHICLIKGKTSENKKKLETAELIRQKLEMQLITGDYQVREKNDIEFYEYFKQQIKLKPHYNRRTTVIKHLQKFAPSLTFNYINQSFWQEFKTYLSDKIGLKPYTIHTNYAIFKAILNNAVKDGIINKNPLAGVSEKRPKTIREYLILSEIITLSETPCRNKDFKLAFLFSCFTGLRLGDIENLKYSDIQNGQIKIYQQKTKDPVYIPISEQAQKYIPQGETGKVFKLPGRTSMISIIREWKAAANITRNITFHSARHTFATLSISSGIDITTLSTLMGHTDVRTTQIYAKVMDQGKIDAIKKLPTFTTD